MYRKFNFVLLIFIGLLVMISCRSRKRSSGSSIKSLGEKSIAEFVYLNVKTDVQVELEADSNDRREQLPLYRTIVFEGSDYACTVSWAHSHLSLGSYRIEAKDITVKDDKSVAIQLRDESGLVIARTNVDEQRDEIICTNKSESESASEQEAVEATFYTKLFLEEFLNNEPAIDNFSFSKNSMIFESLRYTLKVLEDLPLDSRGEYRKSIDLNSEISCMFSIEGEAAKQGDYEIVFNEEYGVISLGNDATDRVECSKGFGCDEGSETCSTNESRLKTAMKNLTFFEVDSLWKIELRESN